MGHIQYICGSEDSIEKCMVEGEARVFTESEIVEGISLRFHAIYMKYKYALDDDLRCDDYT